MRYLMNETVCILSIYESGLSPTIDIYDLSDDFLKVDEAACNEVVATGVYKYAFWPSPSIRTEYLWITTCNGINQYGKLVFGTDPYDIQSVEDKIDLLATTLTLMGDTLSGIDTNVDSVITNLAVVDGNVDDIETKVDLLATTLTLMEDTLSAVQTTVEGLGGGGDGALTVWISTTVGDMDTNVDWISTTVENIKFNIGGTLDESVVEIIQAINNDVNLLQTTISLMATTISEINSTINTIDVAVDDIEADTNSILTETSKIQIIDDNVDTLLEGESYTWNELGLRNKHYRIFNAVYSGGALVSGTLKVYANQDDRTANVNPTHTYTFVNGRYTEV